MRLLKHNLRATIPAPCDGCQTASSANVTSITVGEEGAATASSQFPPLMYF